MSSEGDDNSSSVIEENADGSSPELTSHLEDEIKAVIGEGYGSEYYQIENEEREVSEIVADNEEVVNGISMEVDSTEITSNSKDDENEPSSVNQDESQDVTSEVLISNEIISESATEEVVPEKSEVPCEKVVETLVESSNQNLNISKEKSDEPNIPNSDKTCVQESDAQPSLSEPPTEKLEQNEEIGSPDVLQHDTEMVSEDELPADSKEVPDTEEVSDEELPGSATENLETEAVSDDEFPPVSKKKRKHESEEPEKSHPKKKTKEEKDKSRSKKSASQEPEINDKSTTANKSPHPSAKSKVLPELEKYWKAVNDDPTDFTGWTYLLQYVDQESDVQAAREAYDSFLALYPYCYGYWRKYADYEKRKGDKSKCEEVFLRGLKAIHLSVDLWLHYLNFCKVNYKENETYIREKFDKAIDTCGLDFRSDRLWDCYIKWETEGKRLQNVFVLFEKLLKTPTQGYKGHFENFEDFVKNNQPSKILSVDEFLSLRSEVVQKLRQKPVKETNAPSAAPPGDEEEDDEEPSPGHADEETTLIREKIIASKKKIFKETVNSVLARWNFEEGIKRPYFHVKPLERCQLNTWREYLDYEISEGDEVRTIILFERCLIACALYEEFWLKFIKYLEGLPKNMSEKIRDVYQRACCIHHPKKPFLSLNWATFEEINGSYEEARKILVRLEDLVPNLLHIITRRINLERRSGNINEVSSLYEKYLNSSKNKSNFIVLSTKYARFAAKILKDPAKGVQIMKKAVEKDPENPRLYSQLLELTLMKDNVDENECLEIFDEVINNESMDLEYKRIFSQRKIEYLEDFGSIKNLQKAQVEYGNIVKQLKEKKKLNSAKYDLERSKQDDKSKGKTDGSATSPIQTGQSSYSVNSNYQTGGTYSLQGSYQSGSGQYSQQSTYNQQPFISYNQGDQNWGYSQTAGYGNYNQNWGGYNYYS